MLTGRDSPPSWAHPFGTTREGHDVLSQVLTAAPLTLELIVGATAIALVLAVGCGCAAGAFPGRADTVLSAVTGIFLALPILPLAMVVAGVLPQGRHTAFATMLMIGLGSWAAEARVLRAQALSLRSTDFVAGAVAIGESKARVVVFEFIPNMAGRIAAGAFSHRNSGDGGARDSRFSRHALTRPFCTRRHERVDLGLAARRSTGGGGAPDRLLVESSRSRRSLS